ncbi:atypical/HisK protein kinase [Mycena polygramma]|nr:atypical/HisK protein kinase [Mycena polygramma]
MHEPSRKLKAARPSTAPEMAATPLLPSVMHTLQEDQEPLNLNLDTLPPPFELYPPPSVSPQSYDPAGNDWATFITAYACGRWDPHHIPRPPPAVMAHQTPDETTHPVPHGALAFEHTRPPPPPPSRRLRASFSAVSSSSTPSPAASSSASSFAISGSFPFPPSSNYASTSSASASSSTSTGVAAASHLDAQTSAATLRWAGSRVRVGPLTLPSPEHELTDPMRNTGAIPIPGSHRETASASANGWVSIAGYHPPGAQTPGWDVMTPGGTRRSRLSGFWSGTADVDDPGYVYYNYGGHGMLPTIEASPATPQDAAPLSVPIPDATASAPGSVPVPAGEGASPAPLPVPFRPPPATAPIRVGAAPPLGVEVEDYFGKRLRNRPTTVDHPNTYSGINGAGAYAADPYAADSAYISAHSVPAPAPRRGLLSRQMSAPLPRSAAPQKHVARRSSKEDARAVREERAFATREFLAPPYPPDELGRRRALYKFNIMNTGPDLNFDRIAHLAKLVFNTKGVWISVVDGDEEWFKSEWGTNKVYSCSRATSFSGHAILQRGDEPMIVLDSRLDWRFAKSPLVLGPPNIRFYAGAPLRTHDGFNIGCLALIDDAPREDFTPRQRHTLKEFAAIAMREMELWRDKIQLRIRDRIQNSMEQFSRECLEIDSEATATAGHSLKSEAEGQRQERREPRADGATPPPHPNPEAPRKSGAQRRHPDPPDIMGPASSMDVVYDRAAKLVQRTLDVEGVVVMDVSHCEVLETMSAEGTVTVVLHHGDPDVPTSTHTLSVEEYSRLTDFFARYPGGKISEGIVPPTLRLFLPQAPIQYALVVPIYNIDKRPFALLCAWNASDQTKRFLEGHELSYLRAIGVIILSAVLKRRMILADKAKSLFISNISHELRTPLHGILAAAELLSDSQLNHSQVSFLETVQACGTSLVETVNHVLDFTKLSGNSKAGGVENVIVPTKVDLMQLIEEAVDGCWIGHRARTAIMGDTVIGSVYSPPEESSSPKQLVETVVDIGWRKAASFPAYGWTLKCEKGGIRRVLMNVFGNSLKFTTNGYVHVILRELPRTADEGPNESKIELVVLDTGKGISENFRKNQLFHPFSQENPLQTGTGLGLAIVNSIVKSESVNGKVDVWSEEGIGTEIKVTFTAQAPSEEPLAPEMEPFKFDDPMHPVLVSLVGFGDDHKGVQLLHTTIQTYLVSWWGFEVRTSDQDYGEIVILNENVEPVKQATAERNTSRPFIILSTQRGNPGVMAIASEYERIGGFCRIIYKPGGPSRLYGLLKLCLHAIKIGRSGGSSPFPELEHEPAPAMTPVTRRNSAESGSVLGFSVRPTMLQRSSTAHPLTSMSWRTLSSTAEKEEPSSTPAEEDGEMPTIKIGAHGTLLRSSMGTINSDERRFRVLVVEDNSILRNLLVKWLTTRGYDFRDAVDGRNGVKVFEEEGPFDVVLLDMSMPILDGIGATTEIRQMESRWQVKDPDGTPTRILALTGMSSLEDKRRAFEAGVDGYLVKPVAFKTLDEMFSKLGVS